MMWKRLVALMVLAAIPAASSESRTTQYSGDAVLRGLGENRIAIYLDSDGDKSVDHGFLLSSDLPIPADVAISFPSAKIDFTDGYARVRAGDRIYDLWVAGYPEPPEVPNAKDSRRFTGYALIHSTGESGCDLKRVLEGDAGPCYRYDEQ